MPDYKPYRIAAYAPTGEFQGLLSPSSLQSHSREDLEIAAKRYAETFPKSVYRVVRVDSCGYIQKA